MFKFPSVLYSQIVSIVYSVFEKNAIRSNIISLNFVHPNLFKFSSQGLHYCKEATKATRIVIMLAMIAADLLLHVFTTTHTVVVAEPTGEPLSAAFTASWYPPRVAALTVFEAAILMIPVLAPISNCEFASPTKTRNNSEFHIIKKAETFQNIN